MTAIPPSRRRLLLTGVSGYIGGTLLDALLQPDLSSQLELFALVRTTAQVEKLSAYPGVTPLLHDLSDGEGLKAAVVQHSITIVVETADAVQFAPAKAFIEGLALVKEKTGEDVHFFHTSGAKLFSNHAGVDTSNALSDVGVYETQKKQISPHPMLQYCIPTNTSIVELAESKGVQSYIIVPPMVYGPGTGFGNKISIQFVAIVDIGKALKRVYKFSDDEQKWALCHLADLVSLYTTLIHAILSASSPPSGRNGFYFAENGRFSWNDLSRGIAMKLVERGFSKEATLADVREEDLSKMAEVLHCPEFFVEVAVAGSCNIRGENARSIGWVPKFGLEHLLATMGDETDFILAHQDLKTS